MSAPEQVRGAVLGRGRGIAGTVYGTVVVMAALVAAAADHSDWQLVAVVASTALVIWVSHVYAHGIGESISLNRRLDWSEFRGIVGRQLPILAAAVAPTLVLVAGAADAWRDSRTVWLALGIGWVTLGVQGARYAHVERLGRIGSIVVIAINLVLGGIVVALKVLID
jgi:cyanophycinase-like exopeptidase